MIWVHKLQQLVVFGGLSKDAWVAALQWVSDCLPRLLRGAGGMVIVLTKGRVEEKQKRFAEDRWVSESGRWVHGWV